MKKLIIFALVFVMILGMSTIVLANVTFTGNRGAQFHDCCELWDASTANIPDGITFYVDVIDGRDLIRNGPVCPECGNDEWVLFSNQSGSNQTGTPPNGANWQFDPPSFTKNGGGGQGNDEINEPSAVWVEKDGDVTRSIYSSAIGINLYQVNRNHWARVLPNLAADDPVAFAALMARNGNVNLAEVGGTVTLKVTTERFGAYFVADENGNATDERISDWKVLDSNVVLEDIDFNNASRRFFPYDAGSSTFAINTGHDGVSLNLVLSVRGNTTLLPASTMTITAANDTASTGISGQWFRVMSGDQGTH